jgi:hypothetical protein
MIPETLETLHLTLDASDTALKRDLHRGDGCKGDYGIHGRLGHIYADGDGFLLCVTAQDERHQSPRRWKNVKHRLAFCRLTQDGDDEGCLHLDRMPLPAEAALIREALGIRQRRHYSVAERTRRTGQLNSPTKTASNGFPVDLIVTAATLMPLTMQSSL